MEKDSKQYKFKDGSKVFFTSDTHFGHANIIKFCDRPFANTAEMDETLIRNWNEKVGPDDVIFHLGDFAWGGSDVWTKLLTQLNGKKYLIIGNHDMKNLREGYLKYFEKVVSQMHIQIEGRSVYLNHYPFLCYAGTFRSDKDQTWQLFGHVHTHEGGIKGKDDERMQYLFPTQYDVGVDNNNFTPISWHEIDNIIKQQIQKSKEYGS